MLRLISQRKLLTFGIYQQGYIPSAATSFRKHSRQRLRHIHQDQFMVSASRWARGFVWCKFHHLQGSAWTSVCSLKFVTAQTVITTSAPTVHALEKQTGPFYVHCMYCIPQTWSFLVKSHILLSACCQAVSIMYVWNMCMYADPWL